MRIKTVIWLSLLAVTAGGATWFFFLRTRNTITDEDRSILQDITPADSPTNP